MTACGDTSLDEMMAEAPKHRKFQRRSSCSALPSTTIMQLNDVDAEPRSRERLPLGSFLRFNNSFSESVTSLSDNSECARTGDLSGTNLANNEWKADKFDMDMFSKMAGIEFTSDDVSPDGEEASATQKRRKKKQSKESEGEKPSRRRMQRRSSWSASTTMQEPLAAVYQGDVAEHDTTAGVKERRQRSSRKLAMVLSPLPDFQEDGVITSFKSTNCNTVMFEERSSTSDRCVVTPKTMQDGDDCDAPTLYPDSEIADPPRRRGRANRRASWSGGQCYEPSSDPIVQPRSEPMDNFHLPSRCSDAQVIVDKPTESPNDSGSTNDLSRNDVMRTLRMVMHVHSGAAKARRRASWTASTVNCLDEPPQPPVESQKNLIADVFSSLKKTAVEDDDLVQESSVDYYEEVNQVISDLIETLDQQQQHDNSSTPATGGSRRMARRSSWHGSCASQPQSSVTSNTSQRSSQTFVLDLSSPQMLWTRNEEVIQEAGNDNDVMSQQYQQQQSRKTTTRPWKFGGKSRSTTTTTSTSQSSSDRCGSPNFLVVSSANMPVHDWNSSQQAYAFGASCIQLTAFGDVTTIGCETK